MGACVRQMADLLVDRLCYENGVQVEVTPDDSLFSRGGTACATIHAPTATGSFTYTAAAPDTTFLGTLTVNSDGSQTLRCVGEDAVVLPSSCLPPSCTIGSCP